ncbi:hypothetical protein CYLTODRAFT_344384 [Cylindrobasidium torrendii FP15055 ss-10]|uniref:HypA-like protein n=1 Tax=Cylindrobasidium torrendii FP15055 ss-10 TaxID=1314674 RepID=A0A0D7BP04_9AGAR|nr:hypothetical protein CYLTODRAFT_344384 [Cylindrobasidium torrendii FP15055 ss-10]
MAPSKDLSFLFPTPSAPPSSHCPARLPGADPESTAALLHTLKENHTQFNVFFQGPRRLHNHISHHVLAIWALGAKGSLIEKAFEHEAPYQRKELDPPEPITDTNFADHLDDDEFYAAYTAYFAEKIAALGTSKVLEDLVFAPTMNISDGSNKPIPGMVSRLVEGLAHPMIHIGYGLEFGLPGIVAEGLAMACTQVGRNGVFASPQWFEPSSALDTLASRIESELVLDEPTHSDGKPARKNVHVFDILDDILKDNAYTDRPENLDAMKTLKDRGPKLREYVDRWTFDLDDPHGMQKKIEELQWTNSVIYACAGMTSPKEGFFADFFLMHLVTSSLFLPSYMPYLSPPSQKLFLRSYLAMTLVWFVGSRTRSFDLDIAKFVSADIASYATTPTVSVKPFEGALINSAAVANPWHGILQEATLHPDEHLCKIQRAFAHYASAFGAMEKGALSGTKLKGAELLDSSFFVRAAGLTAQRVREKQNWDRMD